MSEKIGKERVIWRYDPMNETYTVDYHCRYFDILASKLAQYTEKFTISFVDSYRNAERNMKQLHIQTVTAEQQEQLVERFAGAMC